MSDTFLAPFAGFGLGLRPPHYQEFLFSDVPVDFVEVIPESFMVKGRQPPNILAAVRERYPIVMHGDSMSIGSDDGVKLDYLLRLKALADRFRPLWVSDHLCWTSIDGFKSHDVLQLPYTEDAIGIVCANILLAQDVLERPLLLENPSTFTKFGDDEMPEWAFLSEICRRTGCYLLLDVSNIFVSARNHGFDPLAYLDGVPAERVRQIHLAGHSENDQGLLVDTHDHPVPDAVWLLYHAACARFGSVATMIERDGDVPQLCELLAELDLARALSAPRQRAA